VSSVYDTAYGAWDVFHVFLGRTFGRRTKKTF